MDTSKRSDEAPMIFYVASWKGCFDVRGTRANHDTDEVVIKFPANDMRDISYYLSNLRNLWPLVKDGAY